MAVVTQSDLILQRSEWKRNGKRVVCAIGVFDLLHPGHIRLLEQARASGDILVVGVLSDARAREEKGPNRPVTPAAERAEILDALTAVDFAVLLNEEHADEFIARLAPDVVVQGRDTGSSKHAGAEIGAAQAAGAKLIQILPEPGHSTSRLIERIKQLRA